MEKSNNVEVKNEVEMEETSADDEKQASGSQNESHCLCNSRDYTTFMICCDACGVWYHGDCVQVSRTLAKKIEKYFCSICISKDNSLEVVYKGGVGKKERTPKIEVKPEKVSRIEIKSEEKRDAPEKIEKREKKTSVSVTPSASTEKCGNCIGCLWKADCGKCNNCVAQQQPCLKRICVQAGSLAQEKKKKIVKLSTKSHEDGETKHRARSPNHHHMSKVGKRLSKGSGGDQNESAVAEKRAKKDAPASTVTSNVAKVYNGFFKRKLKQEEEEEKQCLGPGCVHAARRGSNYCCDDCGLALAEKRLKMILPQRIQAFYAEKPAAQRDDEERVRVIKECKVALDEELKRLDECADNVMSFISTMSSIQPRSSESPTTDDGSFVVNCAVCTLESSIKNIGKHMQRCFVRTERQSTYGTSHKLPTNPRNLVCDAYNKIDKSYCKRLRVTCSEHYKEEEEANNKICGAPLVWFNNGQGIDFKKLFELEKFNQEQFCMAKRKHCHLHTNWAQNALGLIDNERMNILLQQDENNEKLRILNYKMSTRGDVISLLCNYTLPTAAIEKPEFEEMQTAIANGVS